MTTTLTPVIMPTAGQSPQAQTSLPVGTIQIRYGPLSRMRLYRLANAEFGMAIDAASPSRDVYLFLGSPGGNVQIFPVDASALASRIAALEAAASTAAATVSALQTSVLVLQTSVTMLETQLMAYSAKTTLNWRGAYNAATVYALNDEVSYQGSTLVSLQAGNAGNTPPVSPAAATAFWGYAAQAGATGSTGAAGASAASGVNPRALSASQNPLAAPPAGTTLDDITYDLSAGTTLTATLYARQAGLDTRITVFGAGQLVLSPPSGFTIDGAASLTFSGATRDSYTLSANAATATDYKIS